MILQKRKLNLPEILCFLEQIKYVDAKSLNNKLLSTTVLQDWIFNLLVFCQHCLKQNTWFQHSISQNFGLHIQQTRLQSTTCSIWKILITTYISVNDGILYEKLCFLFETFLRLQYILYTSCFFHQSEVVGGHLPKHDMTYFHVPARIQQRLNGRVMSAGHCELNQTRPNTYSLSLTR